MAAFPASWSILASLVRDPLGGVVLAGRFAGTVHFGGEMLVDQRSQFDTMGYSAFAARFDAEGQHLFSESASHTDSNAESVGVSVSLDGSLSWLVYSAGKVQIGGEVLAPDAGHAHLVRY